VIHQLVQIKRILFIKDGPLAFFGRTANLDKPMRFAGELGRVTRPPN
jgi:hypothetical protein